MVTPARYDKSFYQSLFIQVFKQLKTGCWWTPYLELCKFLYLITCKCALMICSDSSLKIRFYILSNFLCSLICLIGSLKFSDEFNEHVKPFFLLSKLLSNTSLLIWVDSRTIIHIIVEGWLLAVLGSEYEFGFR